MSQAAAVVRLHIVVALVVIVYSLAAIKKNCVCVCVCACELWFMMFMRVIMWSRKEPADQHNRVTVPPLAPANTRDSVHN